MQLSSPSPQPWSWRTRSVLGVFEQSNTRINMYTTGSSPGTEFCVCVGERKSDSDSVYCVSAAGF